MAAASDPGSRAGCFVPDLSGKRAGKYRIGADVCNADGLYLLCCRRTVWQGCGICNQVYSGQYAVYGTHGSVLVWHDWIFAVKCVIFLAKMNKNI